MNYKVIILIVVFIVLFLLFLRYRFIKKRRCVPFSGGSFQLIFHTNGGDEIPNMHVGIACSPDSYDDIPIPVRKGYQFDGWYFDKEFSKKIEFENSREFKPVPDLNRYKCVIGFQDIEIYAKWKKE
ncbi:MAG: InlB B-repeat-containing protein [Bacilli bacterium]|nr:InlB B-repeat-containing protein [Bacilli bacterium]